MTVDIEKLEALAKAAKAGGAEWSDLDINKGRIYQAQGALLDLYEFATPAALLDLCNENEALRGLYQMHKQTETREMRDLKTEIADLKTGYEAYERVNAELRAECEALRKDRNDWQAECLKRGFEYVRESDDHYVLADVPEMADLLGALLGVEVRSKENDAYEEANSQLNEQIEGLINTIHSQESMRKDAERWRFVRNPTSTGSPFAVWSGRTKLLLGKFADEAIDTAMSKGAVQ